MCVFVDYTISSLQIPFVKKMISLKSIFKKQFVSLLHKFFVSVQPRFNFVKQPEIRQGHKQSSKRNWFFPSEFHNFDQNQFFILVLMHVSKNRTDHKKLQRIHFQTRVRERKVRVRVKGRSESEREKWEWGGECVFKRFSRDNEQHSQPKIWKWNKFSLWSFFVSQCTATLSIIRWRPMK